jgi:hypothetical protein
MVRVGAALCNGPVREEWNGWNPIILLGPRSKWRALFLTTSSSVAADTLRFQRQVCLFLITYSLIAFG